LVEKLEKHVVSEKSSILKSVIVFGLIIGFSTLLLEFGSWAVIEIFNNNYSFSNTYEAKNAEERSKTDDLFLTDPNILVDFYRFHDEVLYDFESYTMYRDGEYRSQFVNVGPDGIRSNGTRLVATKNDFVVWILGSSALFGSPNAADNETIASNLEQDLNKVKSLGRQVRVVNHGTHGYVSLQDLLRLRFALLQEKPDMIVVYNGNNDLGNTRVEEHRFVHRQLSYLWDLHERQGLVNWNGIENLVRGSFSNSLELIRLSKKFFALRQANGDIAAWKKAYATRAAQGRKIFATLYKSQTQFYLTNMEDMIVAAQRNDIPIIVSHQPNLMVSKKKLIGKEKKEYDIPVLAFFAANEKELHDLKNVPTYRIHQSNYRHFEDYQKAYLQQGEGLSELCKKYDVSCVNVQQELDKRHDQAIFYDSVHLTATGNKIAGQELSQAVQKLIAQKNARKVK
jgi:lysophospholipase L1-like esterase